MDRISAFEPDILLVEKSAARFTQDALLEKGIALVLNVKSSLLDRLARCTGAQVSETLSARPNQSFASELQHVVKQFATYSAAASLQYRWPTQSRT